MSNTTTEAEKKAKQAALKHVNAQREADGLKPVKSVSRLWWSMYGHEWLAKQKGAQAS